MREGKIDGSERKRDIEREKGVGDRERRLEIYRESIPDLSFLRHPFKTLYILCKLLLTL